MRNSMEFSGGGDRPYGEYVDGEGLKLNFLNQEETEPKEDLSKTDKTETLFSNRIDIPENTDLTKEQKDSIRAIEWALIGFESNVDMIKHEMDVRGNMTSALSNYISYRNNLEKITLNIKTLPTEIGMNVIDKVASAMGKTEVLIPQFEKSTERNANLLADAYEKTSAPELKAWFAYKLTELKEVCPQAGVSISGWEHNLEIEKIFSELPIDKQLTTLTEDQIERFDKESDNDEKNKWSKKATAGMAIWYYKKLEARGITPDETLQERVKKLQEFYDITKL